MSGDPLVTVVMCVYNAAPYIRGAVESALEQTHGNLEILIVDDGSTDESLDRISDLDDPRMTILRQPNSGKPVALNRAIEQMTGQFYAVLDADDLSHPRRIELQLAEMLRRPSLAAVFCGHEVILGDRHLAPRFRAKDETTCRADVEDFRMPAHDPTAMYRVEAVSDLRYDEQLPIVEGYDYILRVCERMPCRVLGECLYSYRIHPGSVTRRMLDARERNLHEMLRRACERRGIDFRERFGDRPASRIGRNALEENNVSAHFIESVLDLRMANRRLDALLTGLACSRLHPLDPDYHKALVYAAMPTRVIARMRPDISAVVNGSLAHES